MNELKGISEYLPGRQNGTRIMVGRLTNGMLSMLRFRSGSAQALLRLCSGILIVGSGKIRLYSSLLTLGSGKSGRCSRPETKTEPVKMRLESDFRGIRTRPFHPSSPGRSLGWPPYSSANHPRLTLFSQLTCSGYVAWQIHM